MIRRIINSFTPCGVLFDSSTIEYGKKGSFPIDQTPALEHNIDPDSGRPMSDIVKLTRIQDAVNQQAFLSQLKDFKTNFLPSDMSDEDAIKFMKPRAVQSRSQLLDWKTKLAEIELKKQSAEAHKKAVAEQQKKDAEYLESFRKELKDSKTD